VARPDVFYRGLTGSGNGTVVPPPAGRVVSGVPEAGSVLMNQLLQFLRTRSPAVNVTAENALANAQGAFQTARGPVGGHPVAEKIWDALKAAGLARMQGGLAGGTTWAARQRPAGAGYNTYSGYVGGPPDPYRHLNMWQPPVAASASVPQVPVNTLPEPAAAPAPAGMVYPPGPAGVSSVDPEPPFGTAAWFQWKYGPARAGAAARQVRANL
jgi:hypothetical protein